MCRQMLDLDSIQFDQTKWTCLQLINNETDPQLHQSGINKAVSYMVDVNSTLLLNPKNLNLGKKLLLVIFLF